MRREDLLVRELLTQSFDTSLPHLLRYADRSSMAWSRELRLPFLDRRLAELAFSLPARYLYRNGTSKQILRDVGRGRVPESVLARRVKVGFEPPQAQWLDHPAFRERIAEVLLDPCARRRGLYDDGAVEADVKAGSWRDPDGIWWALNAELWLRRLVEVRLRFLSRPDHAFEHPPRNAARIVVGLDELPAGRTDFAATRRVGDERAQIVRQRRGSRPHDGKVVAKRVVLGLILPDVGETGRPEAIDSTAKPPYQPRRSWSTTT